MQITYLFGVFVPKNIRDGETLSFKEVVPVKVTRLQKEMLLVSPDKRKTFVNEAYRALNEVDPELVKGYESTHDFMVLDPTKKRAVELEPYIRELEQEIQTNPLTVDLMGHEVAKVQ